MSTKHLYVITSCIRALAAKVRQGVAQPVNYTAIQRQTEQQHKQDTEML